MEVVYFLRAFVLIAALIYGTLNYHYRDRPKAGRRTRSSETGICGLIRHRRHRARGMPAVLGAGAARFFSNQILRSAFCVFFGGENAESLQAHHYSARAFA
jgi:hypothetical protein